MPPRLLRATGRTSSRSAYINDRVRRLHGHTFEQVNGFRYEKNGQIVAYSEKDLKYDIDHGYVELAAKVIVIKNFKTPVHPEQQLLAKSEYCDAYTSACLITTGSEPLSCCQMLLWSDKDDWCNAEDAECYALEHKHKSWVVIDRGKVPDGKKIYRCKFVYKDKPACPPLPARKKARLVATAWNDDVCAADTYAPVCRIDTVRTLLAITARRGYKLSCWDICEAFLLAPLAPEDYVYMEMPPGRKEQGKVLELRRSIYGLRQSPKNFNRHLHNFLVSDKVGFEACPSDPALYKRKSALGSVYACIWVDDILAGGDAAAVADFQAKLEAEFEIRDYGEPKVFLGFDISRNHAHGTIHCDQRTYIRNMCERFPDLPSELIPTPLDAGTLLTESCNGSQLCNAEDYRSLVGSLQYAANVCRCDIGFSVHRLSRFLSAPTVAHLAQARRTLAYLRDTPTYGPTFGNDPSNLAGWCDADFGGCLDTRRSTTGYLYMFAGGPISWRSKIQHSVADSTAESEFRAIAKCGRHGEWLRDLFSDFDEKCLYPTPLHEDNEACAKWCRNPCDYQKQKHIHRDCLSIRESVQEFRHFDIVVVKTAAQISDCLTKALPPQLHRAAVKAIFKI
jgi:hypothetical protein